MKVFKITPEIEVVCNSINTKYGFKHLATMFKDGQEIQDGKCTYQNRTWEAYEFESVLISVINKAHKNKLISNEEEKICKDFTHEGHSDNSSLKTIGLIAQMGDLFCDNQKDKNDWKKRMLKAGLENKGLSIPEDWDTLDEDEKEKRLNGVIKIMGESK